MSVSMSSRIPALIAGAEAKAHLAVGKTAFDVETTAKNLARVDSGNMKGAIEAKATGALSAVVEAGADYTIHNEYGTSKMSAQPMMTPAADQARGPFVAAIASLYK